MLWLTIRQLHWTLAEWISFSAITFMHLDVFKVLFYFCYPRLFPSCYDVARCSSNKWWDIRRNSLMPQVPDRGGRTSIVPEERVVERGRACPWIGWVIYLGADGLHGWRPWMSEHHGCRNTLRSRYELQKNALRMKTTPMFAGNSEPTICVFDCFEPSLRPASARPESRSSSPSCTGRCGRPRSRADLCNLRLRALVFGSQYLFLSLARRSPASFSARGLRRAVCRWWRRPSRWRLATYLPVRKVSFFAYACCISI